jgi:hypothetical protein
MRSVTLKEGMSLELAQVIAQLVQAIAPLREAEGGQDGLMDLLGRPATDLRSTVQEDFHQPDDARLVDLDARIVSHRGPAWAAGSAGSMRRFPVLAGIETLTILVDNDQSGAGQDAARECSARWTAAGRDVIRLVLLHRSGVFDAATNAAKQPAVGEQPYRLEVIHAGKLQPIPQPTGLRQGLRKALDCRLNSSVSSSADAIRTSQHCGRCRLLDTRSHDDPLDELPSS